MEEVSLQVLLLGDTSVGKTCFMTRYIEDKFCNQLNTIGIDSRVKTLERNNKTIYLKIFDTAGQERYRTIVKNYYKGADGIVLIYDVTNLESFKAIKTWVESIKENIDLNEIGLIVVGNKIDLPDKVISDEDKKELEDSLNTKIIEASAKENIMVKEIFEKLVDIMMEIKSKTDKDENVLGNSIKLDQFDLNEINNNEKNSDCCISSKKRK